MNKNNIYTWALTIALSMSCAVPTAFAQGNSNNNKEAAGQGKQENANDKANREHNRPQRLRDMVKEQKEKAKAESEKSKAKNNGQNKPEKADKENNGKAYGKNKGELSGREFGQARAESAKLNRQQKHQVLQETVANGDEKVTEARGRLSRALEELERRRKAGTITDTEYNEKKATATRAEKAIQTLEEKLNAAKVLVSVPVVE